MNHSIIILDANILVKVLFEEHDSADANGFLQACIKRQVTILVPEHFLYEVVNVCKHLGIEISLVLEFFEGLKSSILTVAVPQRDTWLLAEKIAKQGHEKSGFPSMYDSIYQAVAIQTDGVFVTADKRHFVKSQKFGHICQLKDWETLFETPPIEPNEETIKALNEFLSDTKKFKSVDELMKYLNSDD